MVVTIIWIVAASLVAFGLFVAFFASYQIFKNTLRRDEKKARTRECSLASNPDLKRMFDLGTQWADNYRDSIDELSIVNDGLNLFGEYMNLGHDKCAVIIQGRTESLLYSYYFADAYVKSGYNILVIDIRAHGLSDGKYVTAGIKEHEDLIMWIDLIRTKYGVTSFVMHGVCIGAAAAIYTYCATKKENLIEKLVLDGTFVSYYEIFKNHMIDLKKPVLFFVYLTFFYSYMCTGVSLLKETPLKRVGEIEIPVLFIWSRKDVFCPPHKSEELYAACGSKYKQVSFFPEGNHSFVRYFNTEGYDNAILEFLK